MENVPTHLQIPTVRIFLFPHSSYFLTEIRSAQLDHIYDTPTSWLKLTVLPELKCFSLKM